MASKPANLVLPALDLSSWTFNFGSTGPRSLGTTIVRDFATTLDLLIWIASNSDLKSAVQMQVQERMRSDPNWKQWKRQRTFFRDAPHFDSYRGSSYDEFHAAARSIVAGIGAPPTASQIGMYRGLMAEIASSAVILPAGQSLFHGRADRDLEALPKYPAFLSTSVDPVVASNHANKRAFNTPRRQIVYHLSLRTSRPAFFGQAGNAHEYELLLPAGLTVTANAVHRAADFDIVEAYIHGGRVPLFALG